LRLANGENVKAVSVDAGHSTIVITLNYYTHMLPEMHEQAAERMENLFFKTGT
jgi:integrase